MISRWKTFNTIIETITLRTPGRRLSLVFVSDNTFVGSTLTLGWARRTGCGGEPTPSPRPFKILITSFLLTKRHADISVFFLLITFFIMFFNAFIRNMRFLLERLVGHLLLHSLIFVDCGIKIKRVGLRASRQRNAKTVHELWRRNFEQFLTITL